MIDTMERPVIMSMICPAKLPICIQISAAKASIAPDKTSFMTMKA